MKRTCSWIKLFPKSITEIAYFYELPCSLLIRLHKVWGLISDAESRIEAERVRNTDQLIAYA